MSGCRSTFSLAVDAQPAPGPLPTLVERCKIAKPDRLQLDPFEDPRLPTLTANGSGIVYVSAHEQRCAWFVGHGAGGAPKASLLSPSGSLARRFR
jgi:hypothetical protein